MVCTVLMKSCMLVCLSSKLADISLKIEAGLSGITCELFACLAANMDLITDYVCIMSAAQMKHWHLVIAAIAAIVGFVAQGGKRAAARLSSALLTSLLAARHAPQDPAVPILGCLHRKYRMYVLFTV